MLQPSVGLLVHYLELYDRLAPEARPRVERFVAEVNGALKKRGLTVVAAPICRTAPEFDAAVRAFESKRADAIVSLHAAYSPSLESADALVSSRVPVIVLDTTPSFSYGPGQDPGDLLHNHGIHGVQDLCNVLLRRGKPFEVEAGHWERSDVLDRVAAWSRAASAGALFRTMRVGRLAGAFAGMGDFAVTNEALASGLGIEVIECDLDRLRTLLPARGAPEVATEMASDLRAFDTHALGYVEHLATTRACLAVRKWLEEDGLSAFTMNFAAFDARCGIPTVPFLEASKAMARGQGYAGEGDALTAAFVGVLASAWPSVTFTEMFCPDWEGNRIFVSHMGELNPSLADGRARLIAKPMPWVSVGTPVIAAGRLRSGVATLADLAPAADGAFRLLTARVEVADVKGDDRHGDAVRGWFTPPIAVPRFLEAYSKDGGTHHAALVYGDVRADLSRLARLMGWALTEIG